MTNTNTNKLAIRISQLYKSFEVGKKSVPVLNGLDLEIYLGDFVVILGPSGCGKSTLLNTILGLEPPTAGEVLVRGRDIYRLDEDRRAAFRHQNFGMVYQRPNWVKSLNVAENIALPLDIVGLKHRHNIQRAVIALEDFGLGDFYKYDALELSSGQQQKVAACRALITDPPIILADEPTGNLDSVSAATVMDDFIRLNEKLGRTIVMVTHNPNYAIYASKTVFMENGKIIRIVDKNKPANNKDVKLPTSKDQPASGDQI
jgi:putative ABC transport system ATP-binding protein